MDMNEEKKVTKRRLLPEGWRIFKIVGCSEEVKSKSGNNQYIITLEDKETGYQDNVYAVSEPKKRWFLKEILESCSVPQKDGIYTFEPPLSKSLIGKYIEGLVEHEDNEWINREGKTITTKQHRINEVRLQTSIAWDE